MRCDFTFRCIRSIRTFLRTLATSFFLAAFCFHVFLSSAEKVAPVPLMLDLKPAVDFILLENLESGVWYTLLDELPGVRYPFDNLIFDINLSGVDSGPADA